MGGENEPAANPMPLPGIVVPIQLPISGTIDPAALQQTVNAQQKAGQAQTRVGQGDAELDDLGFGTDPDFVSTTEHFEGMTHQAMYQAVHGAANGLGGLDAAGLRTLQRIWFDNHSDLVNLSTFNLMGMNRIFGNGLWQGASGEAAQAASQRFSQAANQIGRVFDSVSSRLDSLAWSAEAVRTAVQPPPTSTAAPNPDNPAESILPGLINPEYDEQTRTAQEQARQAAIRALNTAYTPTFPPAGTGVPAYTTVPQIAGEDGPTTGTGPASSASGNAPDDNTQTPTQSPTQTGTGNESETSTNPSGFGLPEGLLPDTNNTATTPTSTTPAAVNPNAAATTASPSTGPGPNSLGSNGPGGSSSEPGGPGSTRPGVPGTSPVGAAASSSGARGATSASAGRMGPMTPGAGARKKDETEAEHYAPDYLRRVHSDWTEDLTSPVGDIGADLAPAHDAGFGQDWGFDDAPRPNPPARADYTSPEPAVPVEPAPAPPVTFTGAGPMDSSPAPVAPVESAPAPPVTFTGVGPMDSGPDSAAPVEPAPVPPTTFTGVGPMDTSPEPTAPVESTPAQPVTFTGVGPLDSNADEPTGGTRR